MKKFILVIITVLIFNCNVNAKTDIEITGDYLKVLLPTTAALISIKPYQDYAGLWQFSKSFGTTVICTYSLKYFINEKRPNGKDYSFPSGHAASAFSSASYLQKRYGWKFGIPSYALASFVGFSRIYTKQHYIHDVLAGAILAIGFNYYFIDYPFSLSAGYNNSVSSVSFNWSF